MEIFKTTQDAPFDPRKVPYKATRIRVPEFLCDDLLARKPTSETKLLCTVCPQEGRLTCTGCHAARYCSAKCQKLDRPTHKSFCGSFSSFAADKRPSPLHIRAILFPEKQTKPEWTWVLTNEDGTAVDVSRLYENLPTDGLREEMAVTYLSHHASRVPQHWLTGLGLSQKSKGERASSINKSHMNMGPPGHLQTYWGPIVVVAGKPERVIPADGMGMLVRVEDLEMEDVWPVIEAMIYGDQDHPCVVNVPRYPFKSIPGLKINCLGDRHRLRRKLDPNSDAAVYEAVTVPNKHPEPLGKQYPSILAFLLGLPWLCRIVMAQGDRRHPDRATDPRLEANDALGDLNACLSEHGSKLLGLPAPLVLDMHPANIEISKPAGTCILVHVFGEPILAEHVKVVNLFVRETNVQNAWHIVGTGHKTYNRDLFREFWEDMKRENAIPGVDLSGVPSPYAWMDKPREEGKYVHEFAAFERLLEEAVTDVFFDRCFRGGRTSPVAGLNGYAEDFFDPLASSITGMDGSWLDGPGLARY